MAELIELEEARRRVARAIERMPAVALPLDEARGQVLAEDLSSDISVPPDDCSAMDGFALRAHDARQPGARLRVVREIMAGQLAGGEIGAGEAVRIMTGAPLPPGADSVVMVERSSIPDPATVEIEEPPKPGQHVRRAGEDLRQGQVVLRAGTVLGPSEIGLLAAAGCDPLPVHRRPLVAVLATGDELVAPGERPGPGQIRNSNGPALCAAIREAGGVPLDLGIARDTRAHTEELVRRGLAEADMLVTSAGVSVGDRDYVGEALDAAGLERSFWGVKQKPGKPLLFGVAGRRPVFGLPGYPVSTIISFEQYVRPAIRTMLGLKGHGRRMIEARAAEELRGAAERTTWVRVVASNNPPGEWTLRSAGAQASGVLSTMARANGLVELAPGRVIAAGEKIEVRLIREE